jgi:hypothetical protein
VEGGRGIGETLQNSSEELTVKYKLANGLKTEFSEKLLDHINSRNPFLLIAKVIDDFLDNLGVSLVQHPNFHFKNYQIYGKDFFSELLLLGFNCPGIRDSDCAVVGNVGYWMNGNIVEQIPRSMNTYSEYQIEEFLFKQRSSSLENLYKAKVVELL